MDEIARLEGLERKANKYVIPWGLEDIIKPIMGYILLKTNLQIDRLERGEKVPMIKPPTQYYLDLERKPLQISY